MAKKKKKKKLVRSLRPSGFGAGQPYKLPFYHTSGGNIAASTWSAIHGVVSSALQPIPPLVDSIRQWLTGTTDGETIDDKLTVVAPEPIASAVPCLEFASDGLVSVGTDDSWICSTGIFELSFWMKRDTTSTSVLLYGNAGYTYTVQTASPDRIQLFLYNSSGSQFCHLMATTGVNMLEWHYYKFVGDGTKASLFMDGASSAVASVNYTASFDGTAKAATTLIGRHAGAVEGKFSAVTLRGADPTKGWTLGMGGISGNTVFDSSGNDNDGTIVSGITRTTAEGIPCAGLKDGFSIAGAVHIPADASDPTKDVLGNLLTNPGGYVNNGACKTIQHPAIWHLIDKITSIVGSTIRDRPLHARVNGRPVFYNHPEGEDGLEVYWNAPHWNVSFPPNGASVHPTATGQYPPKTGWPDIGTLSIVLDYDSPEIDDDGNLVAHSLAEELALTNGADNVLRKFERTGANDTCVLAEKLHYNQDTTLYVPVLSSAFGWDLPDMPPPAGFPPLTYSPQVTHQQDVTVTGEFATSELIALNEESMSYAGDSSCSVFIKALLDDSDDYLLADGGTILVSD